MDADAGLRRHSAAGDDELAPGVESHDVRLPRRPGADPAAHPAVDNSPDNSVGRSSSTCHEDLPENADQNAYQNPYQNPYEEVERLLVGASSLS